MIVKTHPEADPIIISCLVALSLLATNDAEVNDAGVVLSVPSAFNTLLIVTDIPVLESTHFACTRYNERSQPAIFDL